MVLRARKTGTVTIFELEGHLDFETTQQFHDRCESLLSENTQDLIVFNLEKLKFVGSSGISQFIGILKRFNSRKPRPKLCHLSSEFVRMFRAYETTRNPFEIFDSENLAVDSFVNPPEKKSRKKPVIEN